jgi:hypothetical protein
MSCKFIWFSLPIKIKKAVRTYNSQLSSEAKKIEWYNLPKKINLLYDELYVIKGAQGSLPKPSDFIWYNLPNKLQSLCNLLDFELDGNFDITANWDDTGVTDIDSFREWIALTIDGETPEFTVSAFTRVGDRVVANVDITLPLGAGINYFLEFYEIKRLGNLIGDSFEVRLSGNSSGQCNFVLDRTYNINNLTITDFSELTFNLSTNISDIMSLMTITNTTSLNVNSDTIPSENLIDLNSGNNNIESLNSYFTLPENLQNLGLESNQFTTQGYEDSEDWATAQPYFINGCNMSFGGNPDSPIGTNFETILATKNVTLSY